MVLSFPWSRSNSEKSNLVRVFQRITKTPMFSVRVPLFERPYFIVFLSFFFSESDCDAWRNSKLFQKGVRNFDFILEIQLVLINITSLLRFFYQFRLWEAIAECIIVSFNFCPLFSPLFNTIIVFHPKYY